MRPSSTKSSPSSGSITLLSAASTSSTEGIGKTVLRRCRSPCFHNLTLGKFVTIVSFTEQPPILQRARQRPPAEALGGAILVACAAQDWRLFSERDDGDE